jgi:DNA-binding CsgD family transcriptional regulator/tetratricopeptide (TPR) repeat protein
MTSRISSSVLVGRDRDATTLAAELDASATGSPRFIVVLGEAGIGKSRLVREATGGGGADGRLVLSGECLDIGVAGLPYLPIASVLRGLARAVPPDRLEQLLGSARTDLAAIVPELAAEGAAPDAPSSDPAASLPSGLGQARLFERILGLFGALSAETPVVLVVEDVHWIDRATRDLLTFLSRNLTTERLAVVLTCRVDDLPRGHRILAWLAELERIPSTVVIELGRLDRDAVRRQLTLIAGDGPVPAVLERIWRRSEGNPMLVEELFAARDTEGPRSVVEVLLARVARLDRAARAIVDAAAVGGRPLDDRLLAEVLEVPEDEVDQGLRAALENRILEHEPVAGYRFRHELLREVVEAELLPGARRRLHERFARRLEARPDLADSSPVGAAAELAHHFAEAGLADEAYTHLIRAADASEAVHAYADAHRDLERAIALEPRLPARADDVSARRAIRSRAADDADLAGEFERALELTREAIALVDPAVDPDVAGTLHARVGYLQWSLGDSTTALDAHREAVRLVPEEPPSAARARVLASLGGALMGAGRWAESRDVCEAAIACAAAAGARPEESRARNMLGSDLVALGETDGGIAQLREACRLAEETGEAHIRIVGHYNLALNLATADRLAEALDAAEAGRRAVDESGLQRRFGQDLAAITGDVLLRLGRVGEALEVVDAGLALAPGGSAGVYLSAVRARIAGIRGELEDVERRIGAIDLAAVDPDVAAYVAAVRSEARAWAGRPEASLADAEAGLAQLEGLDDVIWSAPLVALTLRACAELAEGARAHRDEASAAAAIARAEDARRQVDRLAARVSTPSGRAWVACARGELARAAGHQAAADWRSAVAAFDEVPDPIDAAYARFRAAEAALRSEGVRADVTALVHEAASVAEAAGARPLGAAVDELAARGRLAPRVTGVEASTPAAVIDAGTTDPRAAAAALGLSTREIEVLELVAAGMSNGEIAERLFITRKTASVHVTHILDKLGVPNRVGAAMVAARIGLSAAAGTDDDEASIRR